MPVTLTTLLSSYRGSLVDLSLSGARVDAACLPEKEEEGTLQIGSSCLFGEVVWRERNQCGFAFLEPLTSKELTALLRDMRPQSLRDADLRAAHDAWQKGRLR